jgi:hypothetical protein
MVPLIEHVFGIRPDAVHRTVVLAPQAPSGWGAMRIEDLPVGANTVSFSRRTTGQEIEYEVSSRASGWTFILNDKAAAGARYSVNGKPVSPSPTGIRLTGRMNRVLVRPPE